ncbi:hypothetical protein QR680_013166 [Steinernema hermaphroditum]|uniref:Uncharacterized protein n=1 Tax=Steinernema hermaphroditum TaxID=289476 RepID=A0AA39I4K5_9BILA|nr:hypothetical protein QR680_013166 [Steinernema hermaphroditum]
MHQLENDLREKLKLDGVLSEKKKVPSAGDDFPEIPERGIVLIERRWGAGAMDKVFSKGFRVEITRKDLRTLKGLDWLNNEVINFYTGSICERSASSNNGMPKVCAYLFFFFLLLQPDFEVYLFV